MAKKITILISGLALIYESGDGTNWTVVFVCDDEHRLRFIRTDQLGNPIELGSFGSIRIHVEKPWVRGARRNENGRDAFRHILNIAEDLHKNGVRWKNTIPDGYDRVEMTIPEARVGTHGMTNRVYGKRRKDQPSDTEPLRFAATVVSAIIEVKSDGFVEVFADDESKGKITADGTMLIFDNNCHTGCGDDSGMYYYLVEDAVDREIQYWFGKIGPRYAYEQKSPDGNCDPLSSEPPPLPARETES